MNPLRSESPKFNALEKKGATLHGKGQKQHRKRRFKLFSIADINIKQVE